jgi:transcriptional regulator with XRE-family HTH domain
MTVQTVRDFNTWLRAQLNEKQMTQRHLAMRSGVDHSTISRLLSGDRMPSLRTATKLARALRELHDDGDGPTFFAGLSNPQMLCTSRVEHAFRADEVLTDLDVRELLHAYLSIRTRRVRERVVAQRGPCLAAGSRRPGMVRSRVAGVPAPQEAAAPQGGRTGRF